MTSPLEATTTLLADVDRMYELNHVPAKPEHPYGVYSASLGGATAHLLDNAEVMRSGRIVVQTFSKTAEFALEHAETARAALVGKHLDITGYTTTPTRSELDPATVRDPDDRGVVGVTSTYTFTATKETT